MSIHIKLDAMHLHCPPTACQKQQVIKFLEEKSGRLVDCAENSLAIIRQLLQQSQNGPGSLTIQTRSWFVKKKK